ncbi:hypothetical protein MUY27_16955 [Mucilaginibacter sp. RS28]|uniref:Uncharacterized protein n=1 Tax=Mucilaginibacter straminoryzae TaxID=2932774 RepID=A0A9X2BB41_9SPHI|nr:hypothetical protein [Mucilaginibacter straminoryzae]MCJ8211410.1 hypothetical protein [Mucilaginibacter straminoryzae]
MLNDNPAALRFLLQDDLYLLAAEKQAYAEQAQKPLEQEIAVEKPVQPVTVIETPQLSFNCLGDNKKNFLILTSYPGQQGMAEAHQKALESTLGRKDLSLADVAIVNLAAYPQASHTDLFTFFQPKKILILGSEAVPNGLPATTFNKIMPVGDLQLLHSYDFGAMLADREKVKAFWEQMKNF